MSFFQSLLRRGLFLGLCFSFFGAIPLWAKTLPSDPMATQWGYEDIGAYEAWGRGIGSRDVVVAVLDNGFDTFHPDIIENAWKNEDEIQGNGIDDDQNGYIDDTWGWSFVIEDFNGDEVVDKFEMLGNNDPRPNPEKVTAQVLADSVFHHGTVVAGLIGSVGNNDRYGTGVAWKVQLMNLKVVGSGGEGSLSPLPQAIRYAVDNGADIINISLVGDTSPTVVDAIKYAYSHGVIIVAAAGNNTIDLNVSPLYPICADANKQEHWVIGVSAINQKHTIAPFSNTGSSCVDITAPGVGMASTIRYSPKNGLIERYSDGWTGTSFAAPLVSGTAAILKAIHPEWGPEEVYTALTKNVHKTPGQDDALYADLFGAGLLKVDRAVTYALSTANPERIVSNGTDQTDGMSQTIFERRRLSNQKPRGFLVYDPTTGRSQSAEFSETFSNTSVRDSLFANRDSVVAFRNAEGNIEYATIKYLGDAQKKSRVYRYNALWQKIAHFDVDAKGAMDITVADVMNDAGPELILSPKYRCIELYRVYTLGGKEQYRITRKGDHDGVSVTSVPNAISARDDVVIFFEEDGERLVLRFDASKAEIFRFSVSNISRGSIAVGDITGDGRDDYVLSSADTDLSTVAYYDADGAEQKQFSVFDAKHRGGTDLLLADIDGNNVADIVISPKTGDTAIEAWQWTGKRLREWTIGKAAVIRRFIALL